MSLELLKENKTSPVAEEPNDLRNFEIIGAKDVLKELGSISKEEYDYYKKLTF